MILPFTKMQGLGNDFVVIDDLGRAQDTPMTPELAVRVCDRRLGVGADQVLWIRAPREQGSQADARMEILNADGSVAEMCGNGIRAVGLFLHRHGPKPGALRYLIETLAGMKTVEISGVGGDSVRVDMGAPVLGGGFASKGEELEVAGQRLRFFEVSMGNPHAVFFVDAVAKAQVEKLGPLIEAHPRFPRRTNVEFVELDGKSRIRVRVWERGAGITAACGTGACASAVAAIAAMGMGPSLEVVLPGGSLKIDWNGSVGNPASPVMMQGPAVEVFSGEFFVS